MKKIVVFLLLILSVCVFGKTETQYKPYLVRNGLFGYPENKNEERLVFAGKISNSEKILSIYKEENKLIYVYGLEDEKPEIAIIGETGKNLFSNFGRWTIDDYMNKGTKNFIVFKNKNYTYVLSFLDTDGIMANEYLLEVYKDKNEETIFNKKFDNSSVYDVLFKSISGIIDIPDIPVDDEDFYVSF